MATSDNRWDTVTAGRVYPSPDFVIEGTGSPYASLFLVTPTGPDALQHLQDNVQDDAQWWGGSLVVEHRCIRDLETNLRHCGYNVAWEN